MIKKILIGIGVLLIAVLVGAGWYFSGLIYEIGFNVNNRDNLNAGTSEDIIFVEEIKEDSVVLNVQNELIHHQLNHNIVLDLQQTSYTQTNKDLL